MAAPAWRITHGTGALVATAIHAGHELREDVFGLMRLGDSARLREEDPFTGEWAMLAPTSGLGSAQKFEKVNFSLAVLDALERKVGYMANYKRNFSNIQMTTL